MAVEVSLDDVLTDGHGNLILSVSISLHHLVFHLNRVAVNLKLDTVGWDIRVQIGHLTKNWERRHIDKVVVVER